MFDGPKIVLKSHVDQDIAIFIFDPFGLKLPIHMGGVFGCYYITPNEFRYCHNPQGSSLGENTSCEP